MSFNPIKVNLGLTEEEIKQQLLQYAVRGLQAKAGFIPAKTDRPINLSRLSQYVNYTYYDNKIREITYEDSYTLAYFLKYEIEIKDRDGNPSKFVIILLPNDVADLQQRHINFLEILIEKYNYQGDLD